MTLHILDSLPEVGANPTFGNSGVMNLDALAKAANTTPDILTMGRSSYNDWLQEQNERTIDREVDRMNRDAAPGFGQYLAEQLRLTLAEVLQEAKPPLSMVDNIPRDPTIVGTGFREWEQYKMEHTGSAAYFDGNPRDVPSVDVGMRKQTGKVYPFITGFKMSMWDEGAAQRADFQLRSNLMMAVNDVMPRFVNTQIITGSESPRVFGLNNHPFLGRTVLPDTIGPSTASETIEANLHAVANFRAQESKTRYSPTGILMGQKALDYLSNKKLNTAGSTSTSILQAFLDSNRYIREVREAPEFDDFAGTGLGMMLLYRMGEASSLSYIQPYEPRMIPVQVQGFNQHYYIHSMFGGVRSRNPLDVFLVLYTYG